MKINLLIEAEVEEKSDEINVDIQGAKNVKVIDSMYLISNNEKEQVQKNIMNAIVLRTGFSKSEIAGKSRIRDLVYCRHIYCLLMHRKAIYTLKEIGNTLSGRDHTTVRHAIITARNLLRIKDDIFMRFYNKIVYEIG